uniref:Peptidase A2 domain-containing protein n=1 Tax=Glossina pallidipes TaxID=7398 RepID=A0A1A9Z2E9_GLOPL
MKMVKSTLVASLTVGGLPTIGIVDTGATRSIIRKDIIGFIPYILISEASCNTIRMVDGSSQRRKRSITVKINVGDVSFILELLVVGRSVDHLTLGMDFLAKAGADMTIAGYPVKLGHQSGAHTTTAAAKKNQATDAPETLPTPDPASISAIMQTQIKAATNEGLVFVKREEHSTGAYAKLFAQLV